MLSPFLNLLQQGFLVEIPTGSTIKQMLCGFYHVEETYLEDRVQTIFLDGKPVDDVDRAMLENGSSLALSAAMPGLVGSTFRRSGILAAFRSGITYQQEEPASNSPEDALVSIKLFNLLIYELGPKFLNQGIVVKRKALEHILKGETHHLKSVISLMVMNGEEMHPDQLDTVDWSRVTENLFLKVSARPH